MGSPHVTSRKRICKNACRYKGTVSCDEHNLESQSADHNWHDLFEPLEPYWKPGLLELIAKYIKHHLWHDDTTLRLNHRLLQHLSLLVLRSGFRAKLHHVHRDVNDLIKVIQIPPRLHYMFGLEMRYGFSVFPGICLKARLAHPRMYRTLENPTTMLVNCFVSNAGSNGDYEDIHHVSIRFLSVDAIIERLCQSGIKLLLCSGNVPMEIGKKLHHRGICCVSKVDPSILSKIALAINRPILDTLTACRDYYGYIADIERFCYYETCGDNIAAVSPGSRFHGCTVLYSTVRLSRSKAERLKNLLKMSLYRLQSVFEELNLLKDVGGILDIDIAKSILLEIKGSMTPKSTLAYTVNDNSGSSDQPLTCYTRTNTEVTVSGYIPRSTTRLLDNRFRFKELIRNSNYHYLSRTRSVTTKSYLYIHFSEWLTGYLLHRRDSCFNGSVDTYRSLKHNSVLWCYKYFTQSNELCGEVISRSVPVGTYTQGSFLTDFLSAYGKYLDHDSCIASDSCQEPFSKHHLHLESVGTSPAMYKRLTIVLSQQNIVQSTDMSRLLLSIRCRCCHRKDSYHIEDLTFGHFLHLLLHNNYYLCKCGHPLFSMHDFTLCYDNLSLCLHPQSVTNFKIGAWFDTPLLNTGLEFFPLLSAGISINDRRLLNASSRISRLWQHFLNVPEDIMSITNGGVPGSKTDDRTEPTTAKATTSIPDSSTTSITTITGNHDANADWSPHDYNDLDLLYFKDNSSMMSQVLHNIFNMVLSHISNKFDLLVTSTQLEDAVPCRCELGATFDTNLDQRNLWSSKVEWTSFGDFQELWQDRNASGINMHPILNDHIGACFDKGHKFGFCTKCNQVKFRSISDMELINWIYILTAIVRSLGFKLRAVAVAMCDNVDTRTMFFNEVETEPGAMSVTSEFRGSYDSVLSPALSLVTTLNPGVGVPKTFSDARSPSMLLSLQRTKSVPKDLIDTSVIDPAYDIALRKWVDLVDNCLNNLKVTYIQTVAHLLFGQYWSSPDPMRVFMIIRSFFVSITSMCRSLIRDLRSPDLLSLKTIRLKDDGGRFVVCSGNAYRESDPHTVDVPLFIDNNLEPRTNSDCRYVWGINFSREIYDSVMKPCDIPLTYPSISRTFTKILDNQVDENRQYNLLLTLRHIWNSSALFGFAGSSATVSVTATSLGHLLSRMHLGCPKRVESVVSVDYGMVSHLRKDIGNIISIALMSSEYLEQCVDNFNTAVTNNKCTVGRDLINYCRNRRYSFMAASTSGSHRDTLYGYSVQSYGYITRSHQCRMPNGMILDGLIYRYLKRNIHLVSIFNSGVYCSIQRDVTPFVTTQWVNVDTTSRVYPFSPMATNAADMDMLNLLSDWKHMKIFGGSEYQGQVSHHHKVFCAVTQPCNGIPVIICNSKLFHYRWCNHQKDFGVMPVMDHVVKALITNISNERQRLRAYINWTCQYLESTYLLHVDTHIILAYVNYQLETNYQSGYPMYGNSVDNEHTLDTPSSQKTLYEASPQSVAYSVSCSPVYNQGLLSSNVNAVRHMQFRFDCSTPVRHNSGANLSRTPTRSYANIEANPQLCYTTHSSMESYPSSLVRWDTRSLIESIPSSRCDVTKQLCSQVNPTSISNIPTIEGPFDNIKIRDVEESSSCTSVTLSSAHPTYIVTVYYPEAFHKLRHMSCGDDISFARSLSRSSRLRCSGGKSGAPMFVSHDGRFLLKLLNRYEFQLFLDRGPRFFEHVLGGGTLLSIPYGLFSVRHKKNGTIAAFLVMQNIDHGLDSTKLTFDLKGISFKRCVSLDSSMANGDPGSYDLPSTIMCCSADDTPDLPESVVLLDQNFKDFTKGCPLRISKDYTLRIFEYIHRDLEFLSRLDVVDYSILLQVFPSEGIMVLGIIDYLRPYTWDKQIESIGKKLANLASGQLPTIVSPLEYRTRFLRFFLRMFWYHKEEEHQETSRKPKKVVHAKASDIKCKCHICTATSHLYTGRFVNSLYHFMWSTSPEARRYIHRLVKTSIPCDMSSEVAKLLESVYGLD
ncbi:phosphatidylinositol-4-phosphate 5-kinase family protein [Babesia ovis]|uniref:Phosphatidylinositol-4-phosphate 5-kinase family protein n=1 Tax=Babesia ovis TaxID=5869 RepID=A0A9W5TCT9_BABOV|nr:phosphatidylinositol-4-phosphate 5-kinase family protein [Babesia ovis]